jgi:hypothetical protein
MVGSSWPSVACLPGKKRHLGRQGRFLVHLPRVWEC